MSISKAFESANKKAYIATHSGSSPVPVDSVSDKYALSLCWSLDAIRRDEVRTNPVYNYSRVLPWTLVAEEVYRAFSEASYRAERGMPVNPEIMWSSEGKHVAAQDRQGSMQQVAAYIQFGDPFAHPKRGPISAATRRSFVAGISALSLTWATAVATIVIEWTTPAKGK
jgi:hypothetical protein